MSFRPCSQKPVGSRRDGQLPKGMGLELPILYSFRRCPYAMRARMALAVAGLRHEIREVSLKAKPAEMLVVSPKATVPVLVLPEGEVIEDSRDIAAEMHVLISIEIPVSRLNFVNHPHKHEDRKIWADELYVTRTSTTMSPARASTVR